MSRVGDSNFDQKKFPKDYEQIRAWLYLVYNIAENNYHSRLFVEFIQTLKRHPAFLDKIFIQLEDYY